VEPGAEPIEISKRPKVAPRRDQGLLDGILGQVAVREHQLGEVVQLADGPLGQGSERLPVTPLCPLYEIPLHDGPRPRPDPPTQ